MKYSQFESHLKSELYNSTVLLDTNTLINNIHSVDNSNNRNKFFLLLLGIFLLITIPYLMFNQNNNNDKINPIIPIKIKNETNNVKNINPLAKTEINKEQININSKAISTNSLKSEENHNLQQSVNNKKQSFTTLKNKSANKIKNNIVIDENGNINKINTQKSISKSKLFADNNLNFSNIQNTKKSTKINELNSINFLLKRKQRFINPPLSLGDPTGCYSFGPRYRFLWLLGVEIGGFKPFKQFSLKGSEPNGIFDIRKENEKPLEGLQAAIFTKVIRNDIPVYAKLGISYSRITDRLKYKYTVTKKDTVQGIISITESENGDTLTIIRGDIIRDIIIDKNVSQHYYFHLIDIPFTLGYSFNFDGFSVDAELGAIFNISTTTSGNIMSAPNTIIPVKDSKLFKTSVGLSYFAGVNISKSVSYKGEMFASARFRYMPNSFSTNTNPMKQNYHLLGVHIGYIYNLSKRSYD